MELASLGWNDFFADAFAQHAAKGLVPARVAQEHKHAFVLFSGEGEIAGEILGRLLKSVRRADLPAVGDWVAIEHRPGGKRASIHAVLPRRTRFSRRAAGEREEEQIVAANIDSVFLLTGLDVDFNVRRIERYLALARGSGARPVIVLNKADACDDIPARLAEVRSVAADTLIHVVSARRGDGMEALAPHLAPGRTVALLGSSGVGKSTLVNRLLGSDRQTIGTVKEDDGRGRHTTTSRELILLPGGALLIDTPGMRELQLWDAAGDGLHFVFPEVLELAARCRFGNCSHGSEPGCAVRAALGSGELSVERYASFEKLRKEIESLESAGGTGGRRPQVRIKGRRIMRG